VFFGTVKCLLADRMKTNIVNICRIEALKRRIYCCSTTIIQLFIKSTIKPSKPQIIQMNLSLPNRDERTPPAAEETHNGRFPVSVHYLLLLLLVSPRRLSLRFLSPNWPLGEISLSLSPPPSLTLSLPLSDIKSSSIDICFDRQSLLSFFT